MLKIIIFLSFTISFSFSGSFHKEQYKFLLVPKKECVNIYENKTFMDMTNFLINNSTLKIVNTGNDHVELTINHKGKDMRFFYFKDYNLCKWLTN